MKVTVKTLDGREKEFDFSDKTTVKELKEQIKTAMDVPLESQRLIYQGKVLKDEQTLNEYGVDGKVLRLVKNPPPANATSTGSTESPQQQTATPAPAAPAGSEPRRRKSYLKEDYMHIGITSQIKTPDLSSMTKNSVENIVGKLTEGGHIAMVTTTIHTLTPDGRPLKNSTYTTTTYKGSSEPTGGAAAQRPPKPDLTEEEKLEREQEEEEMRQRRERLAGFRDRIRAQQRRGREQTNILEIYQHMTSARRALQGAEGILTEYLGPPAPEEQVSTSDPTEQQQQQQQQLQQQQETAMEGVEEGGATGDDSKPQYSLGEDGRPRQRILTEQGMLLPAGSALYASLCEDVIKVQRRSIKLFEKYAFRMKEDRKYTVDDDGLPLIRNNSYLVQIVQRFNNAMGQAHTALAKVQVTLDGEPPRVVTLVPQRRSTNPLLSLLHQVPSSDDEDDPPLRRPQARSARTRGGDDDDDDESSGRSMASMLGSLLAARAAMRMNQEEEGGAGSRPQVAQTARPTATGDDSDDDDVNPFLPGPVALLQTLMRRRQERERQEQEQQQQQEERTVVIQADESFMDTIARIRQAIGGPESEIMPPTVVGDLVDRCMRTMSISEVVMVFGGNPEPLRSIHKPLREFIQEKLTDGVEPKVELIPRAITRFLEGLPEKLGSLDPPLPIRNDVDFPLSTRKFCKHMLKEAFELIVATPDDDDDFAENIHGWAMKLGSMFTCVLRTCLKSPNDLTPSMKRIADMMFPDNNTPGVLTMLNSQSLVDYFVEDSNTSTFPDEEIKCYIVKTGEPMEPDNETEIGADQNGSLEGWPSTMPQEWVPTIKNDKKKLNQMSLPPPLSTAYLTGMPAKRRKLDSGEAEIMSMAEVLDSALSGAISSATIECPPTDGSTAEDIVKAARDKASLVRAMGEEFHALVRSRLEEDSDYSAERFPNAQKFYQPNKK